MNTVLTVALFASGLAVALACSVLYLNIRDDVATGLHNGERLGVLMSSEDHRRLLPLHREMLPHSGKRKQFYLLLYLSMLLIFSACACALLS